MFKPERKAHVYFREPFYSEQIEIHWCKIGPDVDLLGRTNRWIAEPIDFNERFGRNNLFRVEVPRPGSGKHIKIVHDYCISMYNTSFTPSLLM